MTSLRTAAAVATRRLARALFPSVPYADRARILAAMEGRDLKANQPRPTDPVNPELLLNWRAHPQHRWEFHDARLADLLDRWSKEYRA